MEIQRFGATTAAGAAELYRALQPSVVTTAEYLLHRESAAEEGSRLSLVAIDGEVVGWGGVNLGWPGGSLREAQVWIGVLPLSRRRGIGSELYARVKAHARAEGVWALSTLIEGDRASVRFAERRGFGNTGADVVSVLDPKTARLGALEKLRRQHEEAGFTCVPLSHLDGRARELFEIWREAGAFPGEDEPDFEEWQRGVMENPMLVPRGSFTVLDRESRPASLAWIVVDREHARAENEWTATLPGYRGRGLAKLAKLEVIRWAAESGIHEILTANDRENVAMGALNKGLGYRALRERLFFKRTL